VPEGIPGMFEMSANSQVGVALYSRKVLIKNKADNIIPMWLRFLKGVVDSEDIPLNLSRELLQQGDVIRKIKQVVVNRTLRFLQEKSHKEEEDYLKFYNDYAIFFKEGILTEPEQSTKEEIGKLLRFESSTQPPGKIVNFMEYINRMREDQKDIFYLAAPSRELAERSPYMENFAGNKTEVLFCYEQYDEMVLNQLGQFNGKKFMSVEKEVRDLKDGVNLDALPMGSISKSDAEGISLWLQQTLKGRVHDVKFTKNLVDHPCVVTVKEMPAARQFVRLQASKLPLDTLYSILQPRLEINVKHPVIKKLVKLKDSDPDLAQLLANHLFMNAMVEAGLQENARVVLAQANALLMKTLSDTSK
jgi:TNF receptor-associated protein 1